jgi:hypothetical protein
LGPNVVNLILTRQKLSAGFWGFQEKVFKVFKSPAANAIKLFPLIIDAPSN